MTYNVLMGTLNPTHSVLVGISCGKAGFSPWLVPACAPCASVGILSA